MAGRWVAPVAVCAALLLAGCRSAAFPPAMPFSPVSSVREADSARHDTQPRWIAIGPHLVGGWSGKVNAFAYDRGDPAIMYVGGGWGNTPRESPSQMGIYKTVDGGAHWTPVDDGLTNSDGTISSVVNGLWLDPKDPSILLAATEFGGTFRTSNAGRTWHNVDASESTRFSQNGTTLYLASRRGVLASDDDGKTWSTSLPLAKGATTVTTVANVTYAGGTNGDAYALRSGQWDRLGHPGTGAIHDIAVDALDTSVMYASVDDTGIWNQNLYGSTDGGTTWTRINCRCAVGAQAVAFSQVVRHRLYLGEDSGYFVYLNANGNPKPKIHAAAQPFGSDTRYIIPVPGKASDDDACYILQDQGLAYAARCSRGTAPRLSAIPNTLAYSFALTPQRTGFLVALQDNSAGRSVDQGQKWKYLRNTGEGGEAIVDPFDSSRCYFAHPDEGLYASFDGCRTFNKARVVGIESLAFDPQRSNRVYAVTHADRLTARVSVSNDGGKTWSATPWHFTDPYQIVISPKNAKWMLVAAGKAKVAPQLYYSHDGGRRWHESSGFGAAPQIVRTTYFPAHRLFAAFDPQHSATIVVADHEPGTDNIFVYRSTNGGESFKQSGELDEPPPQRHWPDVMLPNAERQEKSTYYATRFYGNRLAFNSAAKPQTIPAVVLTTRFGAFISYDTGASWQRIDAKSIAHHFIGVAWNDGHVYLASFGEGVIESATRLQ